MLGIFFNLLLKNIFYLLILCLWEYVYTVVEIKGQLSGALAFNHAGQTQVVRLGVVTFGC